MEITKEVLQANIASMEQQLAMAEQRAAQAANQAIAFRGGIAAYLQLLEYLDTSEPEPTPTAHEDLTQEMVDQIAAGRACKEAEETTPGE